MFNHAFDSAINAFNSSLLLLVLSIAAIIARNSIINSLSGLASHFALLDNYPSTVFKFKLSLDSEAALLKSLLSFKGQLSHLIFDQNLVLIFHFDSKSATSELAFYLKATNLK